MIKKKYSLFLFLMIFFFQEGELFCHGQSSEPKNPFRVGRIVASSGQAASGYLEVPEGLDPQTVIPATVIHGVKPGKVLALIAGIHAYEYAPILALYKIKSLIKPDSLSGTVIIIHIANMPSFARRTIYYNPYDWKNLNRVFPGSPSGTQSQRIAHVLTSEVLSKADMVIDLHCGDGNEALIPYTYWVISGHKKLDQESKNLALAFGVPHIIIDTSRGRDLSQSKYLGNTAILMGKPAITTESGFLGSVDEESINRNVSGVLNVMKFYGMISGQAEVVTDPVWIDKYEVAYSRHNGLFYPAVNMGSYVRAGQVVGTITDYFGQLIEEARAPFTGIVLYIIKTPPCNRDEPLFSVGRVVAR